MTAGFEKARARHALDEAGLDITVEIERADSVTNEVWLTEDHVVRVNRHPTQRLRREALLAPLLPGDVLYPPVVTYGGGVGADYLVLERVPGHPLARAWPSMSAPARRAAIRQLAGMLQPLHTFEPPADLPTTDSPQLLPPPGTFGPGSYLLQGIERAAALPNVDPGIMRAAERMVTETAHVLDPWTASGLIHGDLTFENILWDGTRITALLDFEYARPAPRDLDLDVLLRFCAYPFLHVAEDYESETRPEDYTQVPWWLAEDYPDLFAHPDQFDRVRLFSIAYDVRDLLQFPPPVPLRNLHPHHSLHRLSGTVEGAGYLDRLREAA